MRKVILLLFAFLLFTACSNQAQPSAKAASPGSLAPTANPEAQQDLALSYYSECDYDLYGETVGSYQYFIDIISRNMIEIDNILVSVNIDNCNLSVLDITESMHWDMASGTNNLDFHDYIYDCYQGDMDWAKAFELYLESEQLGKDALTSPEAMEKSAAALEAFENYIHRYQENYNAIKESYMNSEPFHLYRVYLNFDLAACTEPEVLRQVSLTVEGKRYDLDVGEIRLHAAFPESLGAGMEKNLGLTPITVGGDNSTPPWNDGIFSCNFDFQADSNLTLKNLSIYDRPDALLEHITPQCTAEDGFSIDTKWDGASELPIDAGQTVCVSFQTYLPEMAGKANFAGACYYILEYEAEGQPGYLVVPLGLCRERNPYELGAELLDGVDVESYYREFYTPWAAYQRSEAAG